MKKIKNIAVLVPNDPFEELDSMEEGNNKIPHLQMVRNIMKRVGAPFIYGQYDAEQGMFIALEGSHRIAICAEDDVAPTLYCLNDDDEVYTDYANNIFCLKEDAAEWVRIEFRLHTVSDLRNGIYTWQEEDVTIHSLLHATLNTERIK